MGFPAYRYRPDDTPAVPISALIQAFGARDNSVERVLGPEGPIARSLPGYQPRPAQIRMAQEVARGLKLRKHVVAEAGTGTGKSLAYLTAAILSGKTVVVSTATLALQDQLRRKDLPFLQEHIGRPFKWAVLKGRSNYLCAANGEQPPIGFESELQQIEDWEQETTTGDLGELPWDLKQESYWPLRAVLAVPEDECPGRKSCSLASDGECWFYRARDRAMEAQVLVVNHALLILDMVLGGNLLPPHEAVIIDEAHQLEDYARGALERRLSASRIRRVLNRAERLQVEGGTVQECSAALFRLTGDHLAGLTRGGTGSVRILPHELPQAVPEAAHSLAEALNSLDDRLMRAASEVPEDGPDSGCIEALRRNITSLRDDLKSLTEEQPDNVMWAEVRAGKPPVILLTPVDVAPFLRQNLFDRKPMAPVILTSATISTGAPGATDAFHFLERSLGLDRSHPLEIQVDSPFCYQRQALYYLPDIPPSALDRQPGERHEGQVARFADYLAAVYEEVLRYTQGRAFLLFTSYAQMQATRARLAHLPFPSRMQGEASKTEIVDWFKHPGTRNPVLYATASFWEGVDVPGSQLSCVCIDKIPFPNSSHPVEAARSDLLGRQAFTKLHLPRAITMLKQGVGRLIRSEHDRGLLVLADPRLRIKRYGRDILAALPGSPEADITTLSPSSLPLVGRFLNKVVTMR